MATCQACHVGRYVPRWLSPTGHGYCENEQCVRSHFRKERKALERRFQGWHGGGTVVEQGLKGKGKPQSRSTAASSSWRTAAEQNDEVIVSDDEGGKRSMGSQERKALEWRLQGGQGGGTVVERGLQGKGKPQSRGTAASLSWRTASEQNDEDIVSDDEGGQRSMGSQERCQGAVAEVKKIDKSPQMADRSFTSKSTQTGWGDACANVSTSDEEEVLAVLRSAKGASRRWPMRPNTADSRKTGPAAFVSEGED